MDLVPERAERVLLEKQVIAAVLVERRMRFVHPAGIRHRVVLRAMPVAGERDRCDGDVGLRQRGRLAAVGRQVGMHAAGDGRARRGARRDPDLVHQAEEGIQLEHALHGARLRIAADRQRPRGQCEAALRRRSAGGHLFAVEEQPDHAAARIVARRHVRPRVPGQLAVAHAQVEFRAAEPQLDAPCAEAIHAEREAGLAALVELAQERRVLAAVAPFERMRRDPRTDRPAGAQLRVREAGRRDVRRVAVEQQAAAPDACARRAPRRVGIRLEAGMVEDVPDGVVAARDGFHRPAAALLVERPGGDVGGRPGTGRREQRQQHCRHAAPPRPPSSVEWNHGVSSMMVVHRCHSDAKISSSR